MSSKLPMETLSCYNVNWGFECQGNSMVRYKNLAVDVALFAMGVSASAKILNDVDKL